MITPEKTYAWFVAQYQKQGFRSLNQFAIATGLQKSSLSRYFHQQREMPADTIATLCRLLRVSPSVLLTALGKKWQ